MQAKMIMYVFLFVVVAIMVIIFNAINVMIHALIVLVKDLIIACLVIIHMYILNQKKNAYFKNVHWELTL